MRKVVVSSLIQRNYPYFIINELFIEDKFQLCISAAVIEEYYEVLRRPKFARFLDFFARAEAMLAEIEAKSIKYQPKNILNIIADDADNMILELAEESKADFIITGNTTDFSFSNYKQTEIVTPRVFWETYRFSL